MFTRWVNQKRAKRFLPALQDCVVELGKGDNLITLVEILSDRVCPTQLNLKAKFKAQELENVAKSIKFTVDCGVVMQVPPSADNLYNGDERPVLGFIWALMMKFSKFTDDDDSQEELSAKDALLQWVAMQVQG